MKLAVLGLDGAPPALVFDRFRDRLPNLRRLMAGGAWGPLRSVLPPITCPAWMCAVTGRDPGALGVYGFRNRTDRSYAGLSIADSRSFSAPTLWDRLGAAGLDSIVIGVPGTYPVRPAPRTTLVSCLLTPDATCDFTHPPELKREIHSLVGEHRFDVEGLRSHDRRRVLDDIRAMTEQHFRVARRLLATRLWNFFMMVEIGPDRMHHAFWRDFDPSHRRYAPDSPFAGAVEDYYLSLDREIGELLRVIGDDTTVAVVSDHGARRLDGGVCLNEWLIREGDLALERRPAAPCPIEDAPVDWPRTRAWGSGGYYGRVFLNVKGREPRGTIAPAEYERVRDDLARRLAAIPDDRGRPMKTRVVRPEEAYAASNGVPPDLMVFFDDLGRRAVGSVGLDTIHTPENDTGPDGANHDWDGVLIWRGPGVRPGGPRPGLRLIDLAPSVLAAFGMTPPGEMQGAPMALA